MLFSEKGQVPEDVCGSCRFLLFSCPVMSDSWRPRGLQHGRLPCKGGDHVYVWTSMLVNCLLKEIWYQLTLEMTAR